MRLSLPLMVTEPVFAHWGVPSTDLFATPNYVKASKFCSHVSKGPGSQGNAFQISWMEEDVYPLLPLLVRVLAKARWEDTAMIQLTFFSLKCTEECKEGVPFICFSGPNKGRLASPQPLSKWDVFTVTS